jgi:hypothetical protein
MKLGLDRAGFECRWQCDLEPFARKILVPQIAEWIGLRILDHARSANEECRSVGVAEESAKI